MAEKALVPYSDSDSDIEEETCVGQRGYKKQKKLPKTLQKLKVQDKYVLPNPCKNKKCGNSCGDKFSESEREQINEHFWGISKIRQRDWLSSCIKRVSVKRRKGENKKRQYSYNYVINFNNKSLKVCQQFLIKTLHISQQFIKSTRNNKSGYNENVRKSTPHNKSDAASVSLIKSFIEKLPAVPSHYCRNQSNKLYLPQEFGNIKGVYKIYTEHLKSINKESCQLSLRVFRSIFKNNFHLGFHLPKKDKCITCESYKNRQSEKEMQYTEKYELHLREKQKSKEVFLEEQKKSKENSSFLCTSFDLQKVLNTPHGKAITLFYSRKYAFYNESFYESGTRIGYCFLWGESDGKRGCNEISTIVFQYLKLVDERKTYSSVSLYCDSCAGQNRNRAILTSIIFFIERSKHIKNIKITYLLPGHTMMPVDSIHSTIENFTRDKTVWASSEWSTLITNARKNPTNYNCILMNYSDFKDWKAFSQKMLPKSLKISFKNLRSASFEKDNPIISLRYGYFDNSERKDYDLSSFPISKRNPEIIARGPVQIYKELLTISLPKYKDLKTLCDNGTIPDRYHQEFLNLKHSKSVHDSLGETDEEDNIY